MKRISVVWGLRNILIVTFTPNTDDDKAGRCNTTRHPSLKNAAVDTSYQLLLYENSFRSIQGSHPYRPTESSRSRDDHFGWRMWLGLVREQ